MPCIPTCRGLLEITAPSSPRISDIPGRSIGGLKGRQNGETGVRLVISSDNYIRLWITFPHLLIIAKNDRWEYTGSAMDKATLSLLPLDGFLPLVRCFP